MTCWGEAGHGASGVRGMTNNNSERDDGKKPKGNGTPFKVIPPLKFKSTFKALRNPLAAGSPYDSQSLA